LEQIARDSAKVDLALATLHEAGASPVEAIKALRIGRGLSLADGKKALNASPSWFAEARAADALHEEICRALDSGEL
jgi:ribosomal protein L7/L12